MSFNTFNKVNILTMMGFGSHLGSVNMQDWTPDSSPYIHSRLKTRFLINLSFTSINFSKSLRFLNFCSSRKLRILYFLKGGFEEYLYKYPRSDWFWSKNFYLVNKWVPGTLTNYVSVRSKLLKFRNFTNLLEYPNILVFLDSTRFLDLVSAESRGVKMPSIGFTDTDSPFSPFAYSVPGNNKSFSTLFAYFRMYFSSSLYGFNASNFKYLYRAQKLVYKFFNFSRKFFAISKAKRFGFNFVPPIIAKDFIAGTSSNYMSKFVPSNYKVNKSAKVYIDFIFKGMETSSGKAYNRRFRYKTVRRRVSTNFVRPFYGKIIRTRNPYKVRRDKKGFRKIEKTGLSYSNSKNNTKYTRGKVFKNKFNYKGFTKKKYEKI